MSTVSIAAYVTAGDLHMTQVNDLRCGTYCASLYRHKGKHSCLQQNCMHGFTQTTPSFSGVMQEGLKLVSPVSNHVDSGLARYR